MLRKPNVDVEDWTVIHCQLADDVNEIIYDSELIWALIERTARRMLDEGRTSLMVLEIRCAEMIGSAWVSLQMKDLVSTLTRLLRWREEREEYEDCVRIVDLLECAQQRQDSDL